MVAYSLLTERSLWVPIVWSRCYRTVQIPGGIQVESKTFSKNKHGGLAGHLKGDNLSEIIKFPPSTLLVQISWNPDFYQVRLRLTAMCLGPYSVPPRQDCQEIHMARLHSQTGDGWKTPTLYPGSLYTKWIGEILIHTNQILKSVMFKDFFPWSLLGDQDPIRDWKRAEV